MNKANSGPMDKIWYIKIRGKQQGPYSIEQLKRMHEVNPDTLAWYPKFQSWIPMRFIPELKKLFEDADNTEQDHLPKEKDQKLTNELVLELQTDPPLLPVWFFIALTLIGLLLWHLFLKG